MFEFLPIEKRKIITEHTELGKPFFAGEIDKNTFTRNLRAFALDICNEELAPGIRITPEEFMAIAREIEHYPSKKWIGNKMAVQPKPYEHLSPEIYELMLLRNSSAARQAQYLIQQKIDFNGEIKTDKPLERILAIVEKHRKQVLERDIDLRGLHAFGRDNDHYVIEGQSSPEYQAFSREMLEAPDFPYTPNEASLVGAYQGGVSGPDITNIIIDRILLRKMLDNVKDQTMRENIWYAITLNYENHQALKYLRSKHGDNATLIINEMRNTVLPAYSKLLEELRGLPKEQEDRGIMINGNIVHLRQEFIKFILLGYDRIHPRR